MAGAALPLLPHLRSALYDSWIHPLFSLPFPARDSTCQKESQAVIYRCKMNPVLKKNFAIFPVLDWIATLMVRQAHHDGEDTRTVTAHIPNKGEQLVRYYGYYSNVLLTPLPVPSARARCGSASSTNRMLSKKSFNT